MKTISKLIITLIFLAAATVANAQFKAGLRIGGNLSNIMTDNEDLDYFNNEKIGFQGGITAEYMFLPSVGIQTAILYSEKGSKFKIYDINTEIDEGNSHYKVYVNAMLGYVEMPLHAVYKLSLGKASRLTISAGPYIAYGVTEAIKVNYNLKLTGDIQEETRKTIKEDLDELKGQLEEVIKVNYPLFKEEGFLDPLDFGAGLSVGYELQKFEAKIGMDMGLNNINREKENDSIKNRNIYLSLGFKF